MTPFPSTLVHTHVQKRRAGVVVAVERHKAKETVSEAAAAAEVEVGMVGAASRGWPTAAEAAAERAAMAVGGADEVEAAARLKANREAVGRP